MKLLLIAAISFSLVSCQSDKSTTRLDSTTAVQKPTPETQTTEMKKTLYGLTMTQSTHDFSTTYSKLIERLKANENLKIIAEIDHTTNAKKVDKTLANTRVVLFGNPKIGTPLMNATRTVGLDLPQKMLVFERDGNTFVAFNSTDYLVARHDQKLDNLPQLEKASGALTALAKGISGVDGSIHASDFNEKGVVTVEANGDVDTVYARLQSALSANPKLSVMGELNHSENASSVGETLEPTRLIIFGNPAMGTPLMEQGRTIAIDLPQKMLVWSDSKTAKTFISYNDPNFLAARHGIDDDVRFSKIANLLASLASGASGPQ